MGMGRWVVVTGFSGCGKQWWKAEEADAAVSTLEWG